MMRTRQPHKTRKQFLRASMATVLSLLLASQPLLAAESSAVVKRQAAQQIEGGARVLHALNRLTFGPRPGDVAAVDAIGLKRWFEQQLNPGTIDDSALDARLLNYPAMKLSTEALMERFPGPQTLRAIENQNLPLPNDPVEHALYADQIAFSQMAKANKALAGAGKKTPENGMATDAATTPEAIADAVPSAAPSHVDKLYSDLEAVKVLNLPPDSRMQRLLAMSPTEILAFRRSLSPPEVAELVDGLSPEQREIVTALPGSLRMVGSEVLQTRLLRDVYSDRQLEAVMTDFWLNHFNVYLRKNQNEPYFLPEYEREVIRAHALGKFEDLLVATAKSPAMLMYLDNWQSVGPDSLAAQRAERNPKAKGKASGLNENYARELMELHTLGVGGGYTQADVTQVARVFTGWTIDRPYRGGAFHFEPNRHEPGAKQVLGTTIREGGENEGLQVLHMLAASPATAAFLANKLAVRFVTDDPPPALVDRMAKSFLASGGDIKAVLRTMFDSPEFWAPSVVRAKVKTPLEFVVSAARASGTDVINPQPLVQTLEKLGMPLYGMQTPNGYNWKAEPWVSTGALVSRMNFALLLASGRMRGVQTALPALLQQPAGQRSAAAPSGDPAVVEKRLELLLLGEPVSERTRDVVLKQAGDGSAQQQAERAFTLTTAEAADPLTVTASLDRPTLDRQTGAMAGLLLGSPEFQRR